MGPVSRSLFTFGIIGFTIGLIHAAGNFADWRVFGTGLATAILCPFYAYLLRALCVYPLRERVSTEDSAENGQQSRHLRVA